jgi:hypothetical protein
VIKSVVRSISDAAVVVGHSPGGNIGLLYMNELCVLLLLDLA